MTTAAGSDGAAREIPAGRLAAFEDTLIPPLALPPRPNRNADAGTNRVPIAGVTPQSTSADTGKPAPLLARGTLRASNIHIPVRLIGDLDETRCNTRMSNGDIIITAIEQTYEELKILISPRRVTGGPLFGRRVSRPPRTPSTEPVTPLNYRLTTEDYAVLDRLVDELGATSRSHLISVALTTYYKRQPPS